MPRTVDPDERRQLLAEAAARVIATAGIGGANLRDVAAEAGLSTGSLTHYFTDKRELLIFTLQTSLERRRALHPLVETDDALADLRVLLDGVLPLGEVSRLHWIVTLAFAAQAAADPELADVQRIAYRRFRRTVVRLVTRATTASQLPPATDPDETAELVIALADGLALQCVFDPSSWPADRQREHLDRALATLVESAADRHRDASTA
jgi:AcrR family transcriptional regulator